MADLPDSTSLTFDGVRVDETGIHPLQEGLPSIRWSEVKRLALGFEIHPFVTIDFHFWAFQLNDAQTLYRVVTALDDELTTELHRRYGAPEIPPIRKWRDAGRDVITYVIWPPEDVGKSLYVFRKKHWWSRETQVSHALP